MLLREVTKKDFKNIIDHYIDVFSSEPWNDELNHQEIVQYVSDIYEMNTFIGFVAIDEVTKSIIGVALGYIKPWYRGREYILDTFFITKKMQSKGYGSLFLSEVKKRLLSKNIEDILLDTDKGMPAETFYKKNGFTVSDESIIMYGSTK